MKCQYKHPSKKDYVYLEEALSDSKEHFCIFHERRKDKDVEEFHKKITTKIEREDFDFTGYFFLDESFKDVKFTKDAYFGGATFEDVASFNNSEFTRKIDFYRARFEGDADFSGATFTEKVGFRFTTFVEEANFKDVKFEEKANFPINKFFGIIDFINVRFEKEVSFEQAFFSDNTRIRSHPECNLSKASFYGSNRERVDFSGSKWNDDNNREIIIFEESKGAIHFQALEEIYRRLKQSHQRFGNHDRAGKFYYSEMESRRKHQREQRQWMN